MSARSDSRAQVDVTGQALLTAARDLLASESPTALTVRRIAAAAGVGTMNVYSRFGGKDGVLDELFGDGLRRLDEQMAAAPSTTDPLADLASRVDRTSDDEAFDWDVVAPMGSAALVRGLASDDG